MGGATPYSGIPNTFRQNILANRVQIGCWSALGSHISMEVLGLAGFDWLLLDGEHAPNDVLSFIPQLMALKDSPSAPVVRPQSNDTVLIKRLLDSGFYNFLIPFVQSAEDARRAVAATRYPPEGVRGVSVSQRSNRYGAIPDYIKVVNDNIAVLVQIESPAAVNEIEAIAAVAGVDGIFIGPSDLAAGYGHLGNANHPEVQKVIADVFSVAARHGKATGILAPVEADARRYLAMGATFVAVGSDLGLFRNATQQLYNTYRGEAGAEAAAGAPCRPAERVVGTAEAAHSNEDAREENT
nr:2-dehydro-3-deoxyglucarate aldolase [Marinicella sp. W31]MDC2880159.1 2-dehydro-3-deoxyglucarate aldolase [Marinicella sp. W31]